MLSLTFLSNCIQRRIKRPETLITRLDCLLNALKSNRGGLKCLVFTNDYNLNNDEFAAALIEVCKYDHDTAAEYAYQVNNYGRKRAVIIDGNLKDHVRNLKNLNVSSKIMGNRAYDAQDKALLAMEEFMRIEKRVNGELKGNVDIFDGDRILRILEHSETGWIHLNKVFDEALKSCTTDFPQKMLQKISMYLTKISISNCNLPLLRTFFIESEINRPTAEKTVLSLLEESSKRKNLIFLTDAMVLLAKMNLLNINTLQKYVDFLVKLRGHVFNDVIYMCSWRMAKIFKGDFEAQDIVKKSSSLEPEFFDHVYYLAYLLQRSLVCHEHALWRIYRAFELDSMGPAFHGALKWYRNEDFASLSNIDFHCIQNLCISDPIDACEIIVSGAPKDKKYYDYILIILMQLALRKFIGDYDERISAVNELAKERKTFEEASLLYDDIDEIAYRNKIGNDVFANLKLSQYRFVTPFHIDHDKSEKRDKVLNFCTRNSVDFFPKQTPNIFKSEFILKFLQKVCMETKIRGSVFAILNTMDPSRTKEFIPYADNHYFCKVFLEKHTSND